MKISLKHSSAIHCANYNLRSGTLTLTFNSNTDRHYDYYHVPAEVIIRMKQSNSVGAFYHKNIRGKYDAI